MFILRHHSCQWLAMAASEKTKVLITQKPWSMQQTSNSSSTKLCQGSMGIDLSIDLLLDAKQLSMVDKSAFSVRLYGHLYSQCLHWGDSSECTECAKHPSPTEKSSRTTFGLHHAKWQCVWSCPYPHCGESISLSLYSLFMFPMS